MQLDLIACVDDDALVLEAIEELLRAFQYSVKSFDSTESFLAFPDLGLVACAISDIRLGGMSGLQLQAELIAAGHSMPIIFITAFAEGEYRKAAMTAGAVDVLPKPISPDRLLLAISTALQSFSLSLDGVDPDNEGLTDRTTDAFHADTT